MKKGKKSSSVISDSVEEDRKLRAQWTEAFLNHGGFQHILNDFMGCTVSNSSKPSNKDHIDEETFELRYLAFMSHLLRTFIMAGLSTKDSDTFKAATLARQNSTGNNQKQPESQESPIPDTASSFKEI